MLAVLYDIHGNLPALEAALADAAGLGARRYLLGGDYALFGAWPRETVERLSELDAEWIRGNGERWTAAPQEAPEEVQGAIAACRELLGDGLVAELAGLPEQAVRNGVRYCHGSPLSDVRSFLPDAGQDEEELLAGAEEARIVFGHTHLQFRRLAQGRDAELINPGSVGMPFDGDHRAAYALADEAGDVELRRVSYDHEASAAATRERLGEAGVVAARRIERARFEGG